MCSFVSLTVLSSPAPSLWFHHFNFYIFSWAGWANSTANQKLSVCVRVCLCVNQDGTNHNWCMQRLVILHADPVIPLRTFSPYNSSWAFSLRSPPEQSPKHFHRGQFWVPKNIYLPLRFFHVNLYPGQLSLGSLQGSYGQGKSGNFEGVRKSQGILKYCSLDQLFMHYFKNL